MTNPSWHFRGLNRYALKYFQWLQMRVKNGHCGTDLSNDREGYIRFCDEVGPIPSGMEKPTIGRINHKKGYVKGNYRWQEWIENCRDIDKTKVSENSKVVSRRLWSDPEWSGRQRERLRNPEKRRKHSEFMKGNRNASGKRSPQAIANIKAGVARSRLAKQEK